MMYRFHCADAAITLGMECSLLLTQRAAAVVVAGHRLDRERLSSWIGSQVEPHQAETR